MSESASQKSDGEKDSTEDRPKPKSRSVKSGIKATKTKSKGNKKSYRKKKVSRSSETSQEKESLTSSSKESSSKQKNSRKAKKSRSGEKGKKVGKKVGSKLGSKPRVKTGRKPRVKRDKAEKGAVRPVRFHTYIKKLAKEHAEGRSISNDALDELDSQMKGVLGLLVPCCVLLSKHANRKTLMSRDVGTATDVLLRGELAEQVKEGIARVYQGKAPIPAR